MNYLTDRLKEPSTWHGLIVLTSAVGAKISPDMADAIISTGLLVAGIVGVFSPDKKTGE